MKNEINLLPKNVQHARLLRIYNNRLHRLSNAFLLAISFIIFGQVSSMLVIKESVATIASKAKNSELSGMEYIQKAAADNQLIGSVERGLTHSTFWSKRVGDILTVAPDNFTIVGLQVDNGNRKITINASSASRVSSIVYEKALSDLPWVEKVDAPLQNFALSDKNEFTFFVYTKEASL